MLNELVDAVVSSLAAALSDVSVTAEFAGGGRDLPQRAPAVSVGIHGLSRGSGSPPITEVQLRFECFIPVFMGGTQLRSVLDRVTQEIWTAGVAGLPAKAVKAGAPAYNREDRALCQTLLATVEVG